MTLSRIFTPLFGLFAAEFPDDAALAEFAVEAGVGAGPARVQALLAVGDLLFLAQDTGVPVRMMAVFIYKFHWYIIAKVVTVDQAGGKFKIGFRGPEPAPAPANSLCRQRENVGWALPTINLSPE